MTGAQRTESSHVEVAFDVCLETAKLAIREFMESKSNHVGGAFDVCLGTAKLAIQEFMESKSN